MSNILPHSSGPTTSGTPHLGGRNYDYRQRYSPDEPGEEAKENARVWHVYLDEAGDYDSDMIKGFQDIIDSLLVFASLFSAVVTTFVAQTSQALQPDNLQIMVFLLVENNQLLRAAGNKTSINAVPAASLGPGSQTHTSIDVWINGLFFTSLALSLSTALLSVLAKQWIQAYTAIVSGSAETRALTRHFRFQGLEKYKFGDFIKSLPLILHCSVAIFLVGLALSVSQLSHPICVVVAGITALTFLIYFGSTMIPAQDIACPYRISFMFHLAQLLHFTFKKMQHACLCFLKALKPCFNFVSSIIPASNIASSYYITFISHLAPGKKACLHFYKVLTQVPHSIWKFQISKKSIKVVEQNYMLDIDNNFYLLQPSLDWLFNHSSNASVKEIIIEATCGLFRRGLYIYRPGSTNLYLSVIKYSSSRLFFSKESKLFVQFIECITNEFSLKELVGLSALENCQEEIMLAIVKFYTHALRKKDHNLSHELVEWVRHILCQSDNKWSAKFWRDCAEYGNAENVNDLINQGIYFDNQEIKFNLNGQDFKGWTVLHHAAFWGNLNTVIAFVEKKSALMSSVAFTGTLPWTALDIAIFVSKYRIVRYLSDHGARLSFNTVYAAIRITSPDLKEVELLLDHGWDRTIRDDEGRTLLDVAHSKDNAKLVNCLENYQTVRLPPYGMTSHIENEETPEPQYSTSTSDADSPQHTDEEQSIHATDSTHQE